MPDAQEKRARRKLTARQLATLRQHAVKRGEVRNPEGHNGFSAARRFRDAFERAATDEQLDKLAADALKKGRLREMILDRLWPKTERLEVGGVGDVEASEREAAKQKLTRLLESKERST